MKHFILPALLTFLSLALTAPLSADTTYRLINQETGELTGDLKFENSSSMTNTPITIEGDDFAYYVQTSADKTAPTGTDGQYLTMVGYDFKTTSTTIRVWIRNGSADAGANGGDRKFYISELKEGEDNSKESHKSEYNLKKNTNQKIEWTTTNTSNSSVFFYGRSDIKVYQIEIIESGIALKQGGDDGYTLNFNKSRCNYGKSSTPVEQTDGIKAVCYSTHAPTNTSYVSVKVTGSEYIEFTIPTKSNVTLGIATQEEKRKFYISNIKGDKSTEEYLCNSATIEVTLNPGTYYINPNGDWEVRFSSISFTAVASTVATPENFAVSNAGIVTFDDVDGATRYEFTMYDDDGTTALFSQDVTSGETLTRPFKKGGTFRATLVAYADGESSDLAEATWTLSDLSVAEEDLSDNTLCSVEITTQNTPAANVTYTWETDDDGNINISISGDGATWRGTAFEGADKFKVGNVSAALFFEQNYTTGATVYQLRKKAGKTIALGETITYNGMYRWATTDNGNAWRNPVSSTYIYGTKCNEPDVLTTYILSADAAVAQVGANVNLTITSLNQKGTAMDVETEYTISPADAGTITNGVFTPSKKGLATITASSENDKSSEVTVFAYTGSNLALNVETECNTDAYRASSRAVDGNTGTDWQGYSADNCTANAEFDAWITLDMGGYYDIDLVSVLFLANASSRKYHIDFSSDNSEWTTAYSYNQSGGGANRRDNWYSNTTDNKEVRYIRFFSEAVNNSYGLKVAEIYVYGALSADDEAPVLTSATIVEGSVTENSATLAVAATDNRMLDGYVLSGDITGNYDADEDGHILLSGLASGVSYTVNVQTKDQSGNLSNTIQVRFTTVATEEAVNLALNKPALAGSTQAGNEAYKAVDGNATTKWGNYENTDFSVSEPQNNWWQVDLERVYTLETIKITWMRFPINNGIVLLGSFDGTNWFDIIEYDGEKFNDNTTQTIELPSGTAARYVRITNGTGDNGTSKWCMSIYEFEVYGTGGFPVLALDETTDNSTAISARDDEQVAVTLNRSFLAGTDWYTLCLPFSMTHEQLVAAFGENYRLGKLVDSYWKSADALFLEFDYVNYLEAGMPYVMRPSKDITVLNVSNVVVNADAPIENRQGTAATMVGIYAPYQIPYEYYFLGSNNYLMQNNNGSSMRGFRAYFKFEQQLPGNARARIVMRSDQTTIATSLEQTIKPVQAEKFFQNGQLLIRKNGTIYTVFGIKAE